MLAEYFNISDLDTTNAQIAEYLLENIRHIGKKSLNEISSDSYFLNQHYLGFFLINVVYHIMSLVSMILWMC